MKIIRVLFKNQSLEIQQEGSRKFVTFTPTSPTDTLVVDNHPMGGQICDLRLIQAQLELGNVPTLYEDNTSQETLLARLLSDVKEFSIKTSGDYTDNQIKINSEGMVRRYTRSDGSSYYVAETSKGQVQFAQDANYFAEIVTGSGLFKRTITDRNTGAFSSLYQTSDEQGQKIVRIENDLITQNTLINNVKRTADSTIETLKNYSTSEQVTAEIKRTADTLSEKITSSDGRINSIVSDLNGTTQNIINKDTVARTIMSSEVYQREISSLKDPNLLNGVSLFPSMFFYDTGRIVGSSDHQSSGWVNVEPNKEYFLLTTIEGSPELAWIFQQENGTIVKGNSSRGQEVIITTPSDVTKMKVRHGYPNQAPDFSKEKMYLYPNNAINTKLTNLSTRVTQTASSWAVQTLTNRNTILSQLNLTTSGVRIAGKLIHLDGTVTMDNAFIRKLMVDQMTATEVTAFMGRFGSIIATNIDVNNLTGNKAQFIQALFNGIYSKLKITGDSVDIIDNTGYSAIKMLDFGMQVFRKGQRSGWFQTYEGGVAMIADSGNDLALGYRSDNNSTAFKTILGIKNYGSDVSLNASGMIKLSSGNSSIQINSGTTTLSGGKSWITINDNDIKLIVNGVSFSMTEVFREIGYKF